MRWRDKALFKVYADEIQERVPDDMGRNLTPLEIDYILAVLEADIPEMIDEYTDELISKIFNADLEGIPLSQLEEERLYGKL